MNRLNLVGVAMFLALTVGIGGCKIVADEPMDGSVMDAGGRDAATRDADAMDATLDGGGGSVHDAAPADGASDAARRDGGAPDAASADAATAPLDAGTLIIVTPANSSRTILPGCVNGVRSTGILPSCMGSVGVGRGDRYAIRLSFREVYRTQRLAGHFTFDETTGGAYSAAISETPGSFDVAPACKDEAGFFPRVQYLNQREIDETLLRYPRLTESDILVDHCLIDPARTYYLNVNVIGSCRKDDPSRRPCWASILQQGDQFQF